MSPKLSIPSAYPVSLHICHCYLQIQSRPKSNESVLYHAQTHFNILYAITLRIPLIHIKHSVFLLFLHNAVEGIWVQMCEGFFLKQKNRKRNKERRGRRGDLTCIPEYGTDEKLKWRIRNCLHQAWWIIENSDQAGPVDQYDHVIKAQTVLRDMTPLRDGQFNLSWHIAVIQVI